MTVTMQLQCAFIDGNEKRRDQAKPGLRKCIEKANSHCRKSKKKVLLPSQAFFLLGSILNLPGLKFYLLYCEQGKTRPHERTASELGKQGIFFPSRHTLEKKFLVFLARQKKKFLVFLARQEKKFLIFLARQKIKFLFSSFSSLPKFSQNSQNTSTQIDHLVRPSISGYEMV